MEDEIAQFCGITSASCVTSFSSAKRALLTISHRVKEARAYLTKFKRLDLSIDAYYSSSLSASPAPAPTASRTASSAPSTSKLNALFERYKDPDDTANIGIDGTIKMCEDLGVDPEDPVLLALALELKSKRMGQWAKKEWVDGWKSLSYVLSCLSSGTSIFTCLQMR